MSGAVNSGRVIRFTCDVHGEVWSAAVYCQHDIDAEMRDVSLGHRKPYGAGCSAVMHVELLDAETLQPERVIHA
jgi:hypothetical protein